MPRRARQVVAGNAGAPGKSGRSKRSNQKIPSSCHFASPSISCLKYVMAHLLHLLRKTTCLSRKTIIPKKPLAKGHKKAISRQIRWCLRGFAAGAFAPAALVLSRLRRWCLRSAVPRWCLEPTVAAGTNRVRGPTGSDLITTVDCHSRFSLS